LINKICDGSPWKDPKLVPCYNLVIVDAEKNLIVRGGAFFTLNMEYLASMLGTVLTYFIVLVQIRD
jgi:hypothetical protein